MGLLEDVTQNEIERSARALLAQLKVLTGSRSSGPVRVKATAGVVELPPNAYLVPTIQGQRRDDLPFKVAFNPSTVTEHLQGGAWTIPTGAGGAAVTVVSNLGGGAILDLPAGTKLRFEPLVEGVVEEAVVEPGGLSGAATGILRDVVTYEDLLSAQVERDLFAAKVGNLPAACLVWRGAQRAEGLTAGIRQGATRKGRGRAIYRHRWELFLIAGKADGDHQRRRQGVILLQAARRLLQDRMRNDDGEQLSVASTGVEIEGMARFVRSRSSYIYVLTLRTLATFRSGPYDQRTFAPWLETRTKIAAAAEPPDLPAELPVVDATDEMEQPP